jgi:hypothetical protein
MRSIRTNEKRRKRIPRQFYAKPGRLNSDLVVRPETHAQDPKRMHTRNLTLYTIATRIGALSTRVLSQVTQRVD